MINPAYPGWGSQPVFSPDGSKFSYTHTYKPFNIWLHDIRIFNFDRCTGTFSNPQLVDITDGVADFSLKETAEIIGKEVNNIKVIQNRGIAKLRKALGLQLEESW
jgi:hypothetical protein